MARVEAHEVSATAAHRHQGSAEHQRAVKVLGKQYGDDVPLEALCGEETVSAIAAAEVRENQVPRLDRRLQVAGLVERYDSFKDMARAVSVAEVGSQLHTGMSQGDYSRRCCVQMLTALAEPLRWRDMEALRGATAASVGFDERDGVQLVYARIYIGKTQELYDCLLGLTRPDGQLPEECLQALTNIVRKACSVRVGKQEVAGVAAPRVFDEDAFRNFSRSVRTAVADGGPTEQKALHFSSPAGRALGRTGDLLFPRLAEIMRDKAHKLRSIQKGAWKGLDDDLRVFLGSLITGEGSLARMLQTSKKYQFIFKVFGQVVL